MSSAPAARSVRRGVLDRIGHNVPQEAPEAFADAVLEIGAAQ
jgi:pimeloyl-ACP methyl ester carboxylesterase